MKKVDITAGLDALLTQPTGKDQAPAATPQEPAKQRGNYKTVCYSIPTDIADKIRYIAYWDRKKLNAVVVEAFAAYCENWKPSTDAKPKQL